MHSSIPCILIKFNIVQFLTVFFYDLLLLYYSAIIYSLLDDLRNLPACSLSLPFYLSQFSVLFILLIFS